MGSALVISARYSRRYRYERCSTERNEVTTYTTTHRQHLSHSQQRRTSSNQYVAGTPPHGYPSPHQSDQCNSPSAQYNPNPHILRTRFRSPSATQSWSDVEHVWAAADTVRTRPGTGWWSLQYGRPWRNAPRIWPSSRRIGAQNERIQRYTPSAVPSPFAGQAPMTASAAYGVYPQYPTPYQQAAANAQAYSLSQINQSSQNAGPSTIQPPYPGHSFYPTQQQQQYLLYPGQYGQTGHLHQTLPAQYAHPYGRGANPAFGMGVPQHAPDGAGMPARVSQYGGFPTNGPLNYGYGPGASSSRPGFAPGKPPSSALQSFQTNSAFWTRRKSWRCLEADAWPYTVVSPRATAETEAVRSRFVGWKPSVWYSCRRPQGSFLTRGYQDD